MYHEEMGIMSDQYNNKVVFSGSMDESMTAMKMNYESIDMFCSWKDENERITSKEKTFDKIWHNEQENILSIEIPEVKDEFIRRYKIGPPDYNFDEEIKEEGSDYKIKSGKWINKPEYVETLHDYQNEAIEKIDNSETHSKIREGEIYV